MNMSRVIHPPADYQIQTSFGSPIDLYAVKNRAAALLVIEAGSGTVVVKMTDSNGSSRTLTVVQGDEIIGQFMSIESVSGVTKIRVGWN